MTSAPRDWPHLRETVTVADVLDDGACVDGVAEWVAARGGKIAGRNADEVARIIAAHTRADEATIRRTTPVAIDPDGRLNVGSMRDDLAFYQSQGFVEGRGITVDRVIDTSVSREALRTLGPYRRP